jgi:ornithine carbamoyltransferase
MPRHLLEIDDLSSTELDMVLSLSTQSSEELLLGKGAALLFEKPSNRTRNSMEMAIVQLGGHPVTIRPDEVGIGKRESTRDVAKTLSCYHELIGARVFDHETVSELSSYSSVPVINMLSDESHPLQALADLLTIKEEFEQLKGLKIAYIGDSNNVARSLAIGSLMAGVEFRVASPKGYEFSKADLQRIQSVGGHILQTGEPEAAVEGANIIYTDVWTSMGQEKESVTRLNDFNGFTVTMEMLSLADPESIFLHCLPAHPNEEVTQEVLDSSYSRIWKQAENRMHSARGAIAFLLSSEEV